jgi:uncharacterized protein
MTKKVNMVLNPEAAANRESIIKRAASALRCKPSDIADIRIIRRSVDARKPAIQINLEVEVYTGTERADSVAKEFLHRDVAAAPEVIIVGSGPAGLFAALRLIELGLRPVILERGKDVSSRKVDLALISREHVVNPDSNYCFGEGGAGTYSDGKLYTRSKKRGDNRSVLELLHTFGADEKILYEAHPHIGTDRLPGIIRKIRETILECGGLFLMNTRVTDLILSGSKITGVKAGEEIYKSDSVILATGHSARDVYYMLDRLGIAMELKPFAMGVRVEHPQESIDRIQYHGKVRGKYLPAASYTLARQINGRGVYSFCMCPGGFIVPSATADGEVVVNGMSPSHRNSVWANAGLVTEIRPADLGRFSEHGALAGLKFQEEVEKRAWEQGGRRQTAPAQRLSDFVNGHNSATLPDCSYFPGIVSSPLHAWLPEQVGAALNEGIREFGRIMKGFLTNEAVIVGVESRSSSPLRIPRDAETLQHTGISGLYPCGEGSGYAGGIVSSAVDGVRIAEAIANRLR